MSKATIQHPLSLMATSLNLRYYVGFDDECQFHCFDDECEARAECEHCDKCRAVFVQKTFFRIHRNTIACNACASSTFSNLEHYGNRLLTLQGWILLWHRRRRVHFLRVLPFFGCWNQPVPPRATLVTREDTAICLQTLSPNPKHQNHPKP